MNQYDRIFLLVKEAIARPKRVGGWRKVITNLLVPRLSRVEVPGDVTPAEREEQEDNLKKLKNKAQNRK